MLAALAGDQAGVEDHNNLRARALRRSPREAVPPRRQAAGEAEDNRVGGDAGGAQRLDGAVSQPVRDEVVVGRHDDANPEVPRIARACQSLHICNPA